MTLGFKQGGGPVVARQVFENHWFTDSQEFYSVVLSQKQVNATDLRISASGVKFPLCGLEVLGGELNCGM